MPASVTAAPAVPSSGAVTTEAAAVGVTAVAPVVTTEGAAVGVKATVTTKATALGVTAAVAPATVTTEAAAVGVATPVAVTAAGTRPCVARQAPCGLVWDTELGIIPATPARGTLVGFRGPLYRR